MRRVFYAVLAIALGGSNTLAATQDVSSTTGAEKANSQIVVTGNRGEPEQIRDFVDDITIEAAADQLGAFQDPVCAFATGLRDDHDRFIASRIMDIAEAVGPGAEDADCDPNLIVFFTADPRALIAEMRALRPELFEDLTAREIGRLRQTKAALTPWQLMDVRGADGREMERLSCIFIGPACSPTDARRLRGVQATRTRLSTRRDFVVSLLVIDTNRIEGASLIQIADLIAMQTLARTRPGGAQVSTILSLVDDLATGGTAADEATQFDLAYLRALNTTDRTRHAQGQRSAMARSVSRMLIEGDREETSGE